MRIDILTLFPKMFAGPFAESIVKRAQDKGLIEIRIHNLREWAKDKHKTVDNPPYGGGAGMILRVDVIDRAVSTLKLKGKRQKAKVILMDAGGKTFNQGSARKLKKEKHLILISGHYEGVDYRVHEHIADEVISIGDYVLTGGEIPAMVVADSVIRLIPGVLKPESLLEESFSLSSNFSPPISNTEYPQYTKPEEYRGWRVPEVLRSGDHGKIKRWREKQINRF